MVDSRYDWIRTRLQKRGLKAKDLARAWGISESSTSRFLGGEESQDLPFSRACILANVVGLSVEELAKGMGFLGKQVIPTSPVPPAPQPVAPSQIPDNTLQLTMLGKGKVRLTFSQDISSDVAAKITQLIAQ